MSPTGPIISETKLEALVQALTSGHYMDRACKIAGVSRSSVYRWLELAEQEEKKASAGEALSEESKKYLEVVDPIKKAREAAAHRAMISIQNAVANGTWQAAAWYLERTDREHYGRVTQVSGTDGNAVKVNVTVDDLEKVLKDIIDQEVGSADADEPS